MAFTSMLRANSSLTAPEAALTTSPSPSTIITSYGATVAGALILSVAFVLGIPGNLFVIWSIVARMRRRSVTSTLILNLACADGMLMVLTPFFIIYLVQRSWNFGLAMCKILYYFCCANMYASIFLITVMSLHRLVAVVWPQRLGIFNTHRAMVRALWVIWVLALALAVPVLIFRKTDNNATSNGTVCDCLHPEPKYTVMQYTMETLLGFLLPYSLILVSYGQILLRIRSTRFQRRIRSEKLILAIVVTFALLWLPYHIVNVLQVYEALLGNPKSKIHDIRTMMRPFAAPVAFVSSCINPVLYMFAGKAYMRRAGLGFMAHLFETTGRDSASRKSQNHQREKGEDDGLRDKESESSTSANTTVNAKAMCMINGKQ